MMSVADCLLTIPYFKRLPVSEIRSTARLWYATSLRETEVLWEQGDLADEIVLVVSGTLVASVDGVDVGVVGETEMAGEVSAFFVNGHRSATVRAREAVDLLKLSTVNLRRLRRQGSDVYAVLLKQALQTLARRVRLTDRKIAQLTKGSVDAPARAEPSVLARLWKSLRPGGPGGSCPPLDPLLTSQPGLRDASPSARGEIRKTFTRQPMEEGEIIFLEGEKGAAAYLVAEGQVDVLRHVRGARAELLASLKVGDQFGVNTLVDPGTRTASCVAAKAGWLYRMDEAAYQELQGEARIVWDEAILVSLAAQVRGANASLQRAKGLEAPSRPQPSPAAAGKAPRRSSDDSFRELLQASGYLEALPVDDESLEKLRVVKAEDQMRNPQKRTFK